MSGSVLKLIPKSQGLTSWIPSEQIAWNAPPVADCLGGRASAEQMLETLRPGQRSDFERSRKEGRHTAGFRALLSSADEHARVQEIVKWLLAERLLVSDLDSRGRRPVEPVHDKLVMGWPRLGRSLAEDKGYRQASRAVQLGHSVAQERMLDPLPW